MLLRFRLLDIYLLCGLLLDNDRWLIIIGIGIGIIIRRAQSYAHRWTPPPAAPSSSIPPSPSIPPSAVMAPTSISTMAPAKSLYRHDGTGRAYHNYYG